MIGIDLERHDKLKAEVSANAELREKKLLVLSKSDALLQQYYNKTYDELVGSATVRLASAASQKRRSVLQTSMQRPNSSLFSATRLREASGQGPLTLRAPSDADGLRQMDTGLEGMSSVPSSAMHALSLIEPSIIALDAQPPQEGLAPQAAADLRQELHSRHLLNTATGMRKRRALTGDLPLPGPRAPPSIKPGRVGPREFLLVPSHDPASAAAALGATAAFAAEGAHGMTNAGAARSQRAAATGIAATGGGGSRWIPGVAAPGEWDDDLDDGYSSGGSGSGSGGRVRVTVTGAGGAASASRGGGGGRGRGHSGSSSASSATDDGDGDSVGGGYDSAGYDMTGTQGGTARGASGRGGSSSSSSRRRPVPPLQHQAIPGTAYAGYPDYCPDSHSFRDRQVYKELGPPRVSVSAQIQSRRAFRKAGELDPTATAEVQQQAAAARWDSHPFYWKHQRLWKPSEPDVYSPAVRGDGELMPYPGDKEKRAAAIGLPYTRLPLREDSLRTDSGRMWRAWSTPVLKPHNTHTAGGSSSSVHSPPRPGTSSKGPPATPMRVPVSTATTGTAGTHLSSASSFFNTSTLSSTATGSLSRAPTGSEAHIARVRAHRGADPAYQLEAGVAAAAPAGLTINVREFARTGIDPLALVAHSRDAALADHVGLNTTARAVAVDGSVHADPIRPDEAQHSPFRDAKAWNKRIMQAQAPLAGGHISKAAVEAATERAALAVTSSVTGGAVRVGPSVTAAIASAAEVVVRSRAADRLATAQHTEVGGFRPHTQQAGGWKFQAAMYSGPGAPVRRWEGKPPDGARSARSRSPSAARGRSGSPAKRRA